MSDVQEKLAKQALERLGKRMPRAYRVHQGPAGCADRALRFLRDESDAGLEGAINDVESKGMRALVTAQDGIGDWPYYDTEKGFL